MKTMCRFSLTMPPKIVKMNFYYEILDVFMNAIDRIILRCMLTTVLIINLIIKGAELLREERQRPGSQFGEEIETHIKNGTIVPVQITCSLLKRAMESSGKDRFLIDGFPRNHDNLDGWNKEMSGVATVIRVLFFNCPEEVCVERCLSRGKTSGRTDDNEESLKKRIKTYNESTMLIIEHYRKLNLVSEINAGSSREAVFEDVKKVLNDLK